MLWNINEYYLNELRVKLSYPVIVSTYMGIERMHEL